VTGAVGGRQSQSVAGSARPADWRLTTVLRAAEDLIGSSALIVMVLLPLSEIVARRFFGRGIAGSGPIVQHLTLWVGFLGAAIAAREGKLLALATGTFITGGWRRAVDVLAAAYGACASVVLAFGGWQMAMIEREAGTEIGAGIHAWVTQLVLPIAFTLIALRLVWRVGHATLPEELLAGVDAPVAGGVLATKPRKHETSRVQNRFRVFVFSWPSTWLDRALASLGIVAGVLFAQLPSLLTGHLIWPAALVIVVSAFVGTPLFAILGGTAAFLYLHDGVTPATILVETYSLSVSSTLPAIPLFTLAGFLLAEGHASERLLRVFRAFFGWIPGGTAVVCAVLCSFFTVFTGGSGVTILALGGVLFPALLKDGYRERFALGLLTASGSLGLLLPPALPLILYAVFAQIPIEDIFIGGILPGILLTTMIAAWGIREGIVSQAPRHRFRVREALASLWSAKWELAMPGLVLMAMFSGLATTVEAAALTALYALVVQAFIHRDLSFRRDLPRALAECVTVIGGVLIILGVAQGLTSYLVGAQLHSKLLVWTQANISSRLAFLFVLNLFLLAVGWLMEIWAALAVVVPIIVPLGAAYGIHPVHLGIIFIANLELGFLTPLVGLNIFLASYRFKRPVLEVCVAALPMMAILGIGVLVITYVPWLTTGLLGLFGRG
jgi:C4-dicarboxylate transporter DctM subunit